MSTPLKIANGRFLFVSLFICLSAWLAHGEVIKDFSIHQHYFSYRALGMGNAFVGVADDYNTVLYNPAGLATLKQDQSSFGFGAAVNPGIKTWADAVRAAIDTKIAANVSKVLQAHFGDNLSVRATPFSILSAGKGHGFALLPIDASIYFSADSLGIASIKAVAYGDSTLAYGRGWTANWIKNQPVQIGVTGKLLSRQYLKKKVSASELIVESDDVIKSANFQKATALDADIGALWKPNTGLKGKLKYLVPQVGMTFRNVVSHYINKSTPEDADNDVPPMYRSLDVGTAFIFPVYFLTTTVALDERDIGHRNFAFKKGSHLGAEIGYKQLSWFAPAIRVGVNQGYFSYGASLNLTVLKVEWASYTEDMGTSNAPSKDFRNAIRVSADW